MFFVLNICNSTGIVHLLHVMHVLYMLYDTFLCSAGAAFVFCPMREKIKVIFDLRLTLGHLLLFSLILLCIALYAHS